MGAINHRPQKSTGALANIVFLHITNATDGMRDLFGFLAFVSTLGTAVGKLPFEGSALLISAS